MMLDAWRRQGAFRWTACAAALLAACSSTPPAPPATRVRPLNPDCAFAADAQGDVRMACRLTDRVADAWIDADHPGSRACGPGSFTLFRQDMDTALDVVYGLQGDDTAWQVRVGGAIGPGTLAGRIGRSAGNHCDATQGAMGQVNARFDGDYLALVDKTQRPLCVSRSRLTLSGFTQTQSLAVREDLGSVLRDATREALQQRLDLEVAIQANRRLRPDAGPLPQAATERHGRCPEGFRTLTGGR